MLFVPTRDEDTGEWRDVDNDRAGLRLRLQGAGPAELSGAPWFIPNFFTIEGFVSLDLGEDPDIASPWNASGLFARERWSLDMKA